ncbi:hypothetical protein ACQ3I4_06520 [Zafaria sp. Z1313]|uniref:hypothetical protein n=1 Tax=unclassified Zafaria TaxID=2828765 RepID=UPI002E75D95D|nr:hypothetical protein [Zafaria sp. J156]MEE1621611.1 hypothetical protein [Zafaria sp. J156]
MGRFGIVYHHRSAACRDYAQLLADHLHLMGHLRHALPVTDASAHELVYDDAVVLFSPVTLGRIHGAALVQAVAPYRPCGVAAVNDGAFPNGVLGLFSLEVRANSEFFSLPRTTPDRAAVLPVARWLTGLAPAP